MALDLHYLITAFGRENDTTQPYDHQLLGKAMSVLYDHALLGPDEIKVAFPGSGLESQPDRVRITHQPLSLEDISKLWMGFATQYRVSVGYDVSVTLIDSTQPVKTPLPVLARSSQDKGWSSQASLNPSFPTLYSVTAPNQQPSARLGDTLTLTGPSKLLRLRAEVHRSLACKSRINHRFGLRAFTRWRYSFNVRARRTAERQISSLFH
jgi:hypothetical protein